jgi:lipoate-protein ligase A
MPPVVNSPPSSYDTWRFLDLSFPSATENLALEEALARSASSTSFTPTLRTWKNPPTVIVGRFQNVNSEVDTDLCIRKKVSIARRFTGGGTVFHDEGTLNLTIVTRRPQRIEVTELQRNGSSIILKLLDSLGLRGTLVPPNSIHVGGKKIAGAAAALGRDFALWHASVLISTNTDLLNELLAPSRRSEESRFIHSRWHPVTTLVAALGKPVTTEEVKHQLMVTAESSFGARLSTGGLQDDEKEQTTLLHEHKYSTEQWNVKGIYRE